MYPYLHIFEKTIGTYGLFMAVAFLAVGMLAVIKAKEKGILPEDVLIVAACAVGMALLFGKLLYILVTYPITVLLEQIKAGNYQFLGNGGIVFYGGLIGGLLGAIIGIKIAGCGLARIESTLVPYIPLGHALGRIGCLFAGCCYGIAYDGILAVHYPNSIVGLPPQQGYFPIQPIEAICNIGISVYLLCYEKRTRNPLDLLCAYLGLYGTVRFVLEFFRGDGIRGVYLGLSVSQWISMVLLMICITRVIFKKFTA